MILVWNKLNNLFWTVVKNSRNFPSSQHSTRKTIYLRFSQKMSKILDKKAICDDFSRRKNPPKKVYKKRCDVVKWKGRELRKVDQHCTITTTVTTVRVKRILLFCSINICDQRMNFQKFSSFSFWKLSRAQTFQTFLREMEFV